MGFLTAMKSFREEVTAPRVRRTGRPPRKPFPRCGTPARLETTEPYSFCLRVLRDPKKSVGPNHIRNKRLIPLFTCFPGAPFFVCDFDRRDDGIGRHRRRFVVNGLLLGAGNRGDLGQIRLRQFRKAEIRKCGR